MDLPAIVWCSMGSTGTRGVLDCPAGRRCVGQATEARDGHALPLLNCSTGTSRAVAAAGLPIPDIGRLVFELGTLEVVAVKHELRRRQGFGHEPSIHVNDPNSRSLALFRIWRR